MHQAIGMMEASRRDGMNTMDFALKGLVESGQVDREVALQYASNPQAIPVPVEKKSSVFSRDPPQTPATDTTVRETSDASGGGKKKYPWSR